VGGEGVNVLGMVKVLAKQFTCFAGGALGGIEIMLHEEVEESRS